MTKSQKTAKKLKTIWCFIKLLDIALSKTNNMASGYYSIFM